MNTQAMTATVNPQKSPPVPPSVSAKSRFLHQRHVSRLRTYAVWKMARDLCARKQELPCTNEDGAEA